MGKAIVRAARATVHLCRSMALVFAMCLFISVICVAVAGTLIGAGVWLIPETVLLIRRVAGAKRYLTGLWTGDEVAQAYQPITGPLRRRLRAALRDPGTRSDLIWAAAFYVYGWTGLLALPLWPLGLLVDGVWCGLLRRHPVVLPLISRLADLEAAWSTALLKPSPQARLAARVDELTQTRAGAVAAHAAELRRIERDLHDGTQAHLVSLSMRLGLALRAYDSAPGTARELLVEARDQAERALTELRHVVRTIQPPILSDRGLAGAVRALAAGSGLDVAVDIEGLADDGPRAPAAVEAAAYFAVAEALTNAAKHSGSSRARVHLARVRTGLRLTVRDEGAGGADETSGTGLLGIRRRVAALDGTVTVSSPAGGPTVVAVELPCVW
ncbi:sensor domain-containing protein [Streptomyces sp. ISL-12]|uniref:sensor histidine kinase n=1 Tax=Streptomyces sp. ISL-12 TaxID=2819177 RepID=UPI001BE7EC39|nr:histidine kinase [Streptomyces sp. ISL-12]MBT2409870.1 sensor domain-containing protein [Streptomyces sp. ISL-12]